MSRYTTYKNLITNYCSKQKIHMNEHLKTNKYKQAEQIFRLKLEKEEKSKLKEIYGTSNINKIIKNIQCKKIETSEDSELETSENYITISSKEAMKDTIHEIHNFLRNAGAGYGTNALKLFSLFYALAKIEQNGHFEKTGLKDCCRFSKILKDLKRNPDTGLLTIKDTVLKDIHSNNNTKDMIFTLIPEGVTPYIIKDLVFKVKNLIEKEKEMGFQLAGKIYEYFIGRDQTAISELGAYFTDRHITDYICEKVHQPSLDDNNNVPSMIDPFGGSGGLTLGYITHLIKNNKHINWKKQLENIYHMDMNLDVVKYAKLEMYCLTGEFPGSDNVKVTNSFKDDYKDSKNKEIKFKNIYTNPPYGGDKIKKSETVIHLEMIKNRCENYLKKKYKLRNMKEISKVKNIDIKDKVKINQYDFCYNKLNKIKKDYESKIVTLSNSSQRFQKYATKNNIDKTKCKDKESVSFLMMMAMLEKGGTAVGVLKEGIFFDNKYKHLRKHCVENYNIEMIVSIDASQFENTSTKTSIIKFSNKGKTKTIKFYKLVIDKDNISEVVEQVDGTFKVEKIKGRITRVHDKLVSQASYQDIVKNDYTFNHKKYNMKKLIPGEGYEMVRLGDIVEYKNTYKIPDKNLYKYIEIKDIKNNTISNYSIIKKISLPQNAKTIVNKNDILIASVRPKKEKIVFINKELDEDYIFSSALLKLSFKNNSFYFYNILLNYSSNFEKMLCNGSTYPRFNLKDLLNIEIPIPKSKKKIKYWVNRISKPYNLIHESKDKLKELENKVKNDIIKMLDNNETEEIELGNLCKFKYGTRITKSNNTTGQYPVYGSGNITFYTNRYNREEKTLVLSRYALSSECVRIINDKFYLNDSGMSLEFKKSKLANYLSYYLIQKQNEIINICTRGSIQKNIDMSSINKFKITLPKDRKLIDHLNPMFKQIDKINMIILQQDNLYQQYLDELKAEALKNNTDKSENIKIKINVKEKNKTKSLNNYV